MLNEYLYNYYQNPQGTCRSLFYDEAHQYDNVRVQYELLLDLERRGLLEKFHNEIGIKFTDCYYYQSILNMFAIGRRIDTDVINNMSDTIRQYFPDIKSNPYLKSFPLVRENINMLDLRISPDNFDSYKALWEKIIQQSSSADIISR